MYLRHHNFSHISYSSDLHLDHAFISANFTSPDIALNVTTELIKFHPTISAAGWGGYVTASNSSFTATFGAPNISWADTNATFLPFANYVAEATGGIRQHLLTHFTSFTRCFSLMYLVQTYQTYFDLNSPRDSFPVAWLKQILKRWPKSYYHSVSV